MNSAATRSASWRENNEALWGLQTNLPRTGNNSSPCCRPTCGRYPRSGCRRLLVPVLQRAERLQNIELRHIAVNTGDAVADVGQHSLRWLESDGRHSEISVVGVVRVGHQVIRGIVSCAIIVNRVGHKGEDHADWRRVAKADQGILDHTVKVVCQIHSEAFARRERRGQSVVLVVAPY